MYSERPKEIEMIRQMARESVANNRPVTQPKFTQSPYDCNDDLISVRRANEWLTNAKPLKPKMLFDSFWFENELCMLFADTNVGKSILAVQLGNSLCTANPIGQFQLQLPPSTVVYFDFEQSAAQFEARYTGVNHAYQFSPNFFRAELNAAAGDVHNYLDRIHFTIEETIHRTKAKVLIIDNLTFLSKETERARDALAVIKFLKMLKSKYNLSILVLAHTPKRNRAKPITNNDMQGSKMLVNFCDSAFAIGRSSQDAEMRYLKQIKQRNVAEIYGEERVCLFKLEKSDSFIQFVPCGYGHEQNHLFAAPLVMTEEMRVQIINLAHQGVSNRQIGVRLGISRTTVGRVLG
jgi:RecA-family ATPase